MRKQHYFSIFRPSRYLLLNRWAKFKQTCYMASHHGKGCESNIIFPCVRLSVHPSSVQCPSCYLLLKLWMKFNKTCYITYFFLFLLKNIDCGRGGSNEYPQSMFWAEIWTISEFLSKNCHFFVTSVNRCYHEKKEYWYWSRKVFFSLQIRPLRTFCAVCLLVHGLKLLTEPEYKDG